MAVALTAGGDRFVGVPPSFCRPGQSGSLGEPRGCGLGQGGKKFFGLKLAGGVFLARGTQGRGANESC